MRRLAQLLLIVGAAALTGCGSSNATSVASSGSASLGHPAPSVANPSPSLNVEALRSAAAKAYLAAAKAYDAAGSKLDKQFGASMSLSQARRYFAADAKLVGTFTAAVKGLAVPPDTAADLHTLRMGIAYPKITRWQAVVITRLADARPNLALDVLWALTRDLIAAEENPTYPAAADVLMTGHVFLALPEREWDDRVAAGDYQPSAAGTAVKTDPVAVSSFAHLVPAWRAGLSPEEGFGDDS